MFLFFDTETTGLNRYKDNLVQLAWILTCEEGEEIEKGDFLVKPNGFTIPWRASQVHGISNEDAKENGYPLKEVLLEFSACAEKATTIIAHNLYFDFSILESEYKRNDIPFPLLGKIQICTMRLSSRWCRLPKLNGQNGFKLPRLEELYFKLFGEGFAEAHNALSDTRACLASYFELVKLGVIAPPKDQKYHAAAKPKSSDLYRKKSYEDGMEVGYKAGYIDAEKHMLKNKEDERQAFIDGLLFNENRQVRIGAAAYKKFTCYAVLALFVSETLDQDFYDLMVMFGVDDEDLLEEIAPLRETDISGAVDFLLEFHAFPNQKSIKERYDLNIMHIIFDTFGHYTSAEFDLQFLTSQGFPSEVISPMLFYVRSKIRKFESSEILPSVEKLLRYHTEFDLMRYHDYLRYIRNFDEDKPYYRVCFWDVALDPDVPQEMLDDIFDMDNLTQERVLLDPDAPEILFDNLSQFDLSIQEKVLAKNKLSESQLEHYIGFFTALLKV